MWYGIMCVFSKNRDRLLTSEVAQRVLCRGEPAGEANTMSDEHFTVDGTLIVEVRAIVIIGIILRTKALLRGPGLDCQKRSNKTHASTTDPDARLRTRRATGRN